jgi:hypothetical protein
MFVTYSPEGGEQQRWEFDPSRVRESQAELIERRFGQEWHHFVVALISGASKARRVVLWHLLRLEQHTLRYEDAPDPFKSELKVEFSRAELQLMRAQAAQQPADDEDAVKQRDAALAQLDKVIASAPVGGEVGKAALLPEGFSE